MDGIVAYALSKGYTEEKISALGHVFNIKGTKATVADLPATGNKVGDVWLVSADNSEYVWTASNQWEKLGAISEAVLYTAQSLTDAQKAQARTNIGAVALAPYDSSATPVDGVLYYTVEP